MYKRMPGGILSETLLRSRKSFERRVWCGRVWVVLGTLPGMKNVDVWVPPRHKGRITPTSVEDETLFFHNGVDDKIPRFLVMDKVQSSTFIIMISSTGKSQK